MTTPLNVLIVDESDADAFLTVRALRRGGYDAIVERVDSPQALDDALQRILWDLVLCDWVTPRLSISTTLRQVHHHSPMVPVVLVYGHRPEDLEEWLRTDLVSGLLSKDSLEDLAALVKTLLSTCGHH